MPRGSPGFMAPKSEKSQGERKPGEERPQLLSEQGGYGHDKKRTSSRGGRTVTLVYSLRGESQERRPSGGRRGPQRRGGPADDGRGPGLPASSPLSGAFGDGCYLLLLSLFSLTKSSEPSVSSSSSPDEMASVFKRTHPRLCFLPGHGPSPPPVFLDRAADAQEPAGSVRARV